MVDGNRSLDDFKKIAVAPVHERIVNSKVWKKELILNSMKKYSSNVLTLSQGSIYEDDSINEIDFDTPSLRIANNTQSSTSYFNDMQERLRQCITCAHGDADSKKLIATTLDELRVKITSKITTSLMNDTKARGEFESSNNPQEHQRHVARFKLYSEKK